MRDPNSDLRTNTPDHQITPPTYLVPCSEQVVVKLRPSTLERMHPSLTQRELLDQPRVLVMARYGWDCWRLIDFVFVLLFFASRGWWVGLVDDLIARLVSLFACLFVCNINPNATHNTSRSSLAFCSKTPRGPDDALCLNFLGSMNKMGSPGLGSNEREQ